MKAERATIFWRKCAKKLGVRACIAIIEENNTYKLELELFGRSFKYNLANTCYPAINLYAASLQVCVSSVNIVNGKLKSLKIVAKVCVKLVFKKKCKNLFSHQLSFSSVQASQVLANQAAFADVKVDGEMINVETKNIPQSDVLAELENIKYFKE